MPCSHLLAPKRPVKLPLFAKGLVVLLVLLITAPNAGADVVFEMPTTHLLLKTGDATLHGPDNKDYRIPKDSHILNPDAWSMQDAEFKRLQEAETRLKAENKSLRESAGSWSWITVGISMGLGIAIGGYCAYKVSDKL